MAARRRLDVGELTEIYTADDYWAAKVIEAVRQKIGDPRCMRALAFCVSIDHAIFMADRFQKAKINAAAIISRSTTAERSQALSSMKNGTVQVLCTVDLFNEGVDIPTIDTVIMLRPTESATIFLQQLGRGLRRHADKDVLTVLDFVGHQTRKFRFDLRFRRLLGRSRRELENDIIEDFPYLPPGCALELDSVARQIVLDNVRNALPTGWKDRIRELRELGDVSLPEFLMETGLELGDVYRGNHTWTEMRRHAHFETTPAAKGEKKAGNGIGRLLHIDDQERIDAYTKFLSNTSPPAISRLAKRTRRQLEGLLLTILNPRKGAYSTIGEAMVEFWHHDGLRREVLEYLPMLEEQIRHLHRPAIDLKPIPLQLHASYTREEILAAFGVSNVTSPLPLQAGVYWDENSKTDIFLVTLQKAEKDYSPTTRYLDYAISDQLFHWESQAATSVNSETGKRYLNHEHLGTRIMLFVRTTKKDINGRTMPYFCVGPATYVEHKSERPIQIKWRLHNRLPGDVFASYRAAVA